MERRHSRRGLSPVEARRPVGVAYAGTRRGHRVSYSTSYSEGCRASVGPGGTAATVIVNTRRVLRRASFGTKFILGVDSSVATSRHVGDSTALDRRRT
jgi:hypothetical protein